MMILDVTQPLITCIMPTYNRRAYVPRAIEYLDYSFQRHKDVVVDFRLPNVAERWTMRKIELCML